MAIQNNQKANKPLILSVSIFGALMVVTTLSCVLAMNAVSVSAESASASINVSAACTFESSNDTAHTATIDPGTWKEDIGQTSFTAKCNDPGGFAIYAVGYSNDEWKNANLIGPNNNTIATNTNKNGNTSGWSMKLTNGTGDTTTILSPYNDYAIVPGGSVEDPGDQTGGYAKVATYNATTAGTSGSSLIATYGVYAADKQAAGTYNGKVKYTLVHPSGAEAPEAEDPDPCDGAVTLYESVACMSKGKQTNDTDASTGIQANIVTPTESNPISSNSGVYEYDPSVFGADSDDIKSDGTKDTIYYYRGILDKYNKVNAYASKGQADAYPNYIVLDADGKLTNEDTDDTCWRIVRTTGSGGVKMIYNGKWSVSDDTGTCANTGSAAQVAASQFNAVSMADSRRIVRVGYTYNPDYDDEVNPTEASMLFGSNSNYSSNSKNSTIKDYIEDVWFPSISIYESILEPSAGYCNDRTIYDTSNALQSDGVSIVKPYGTASSGYTQYNFGAYIRNLTAAQPPSLTCAIYADGATSVDRGIVDLYTASSASSGNRQLAKPVALLTADESSFAGSGSSAASQGSSYSTRSFLISGSNFWLLSPYDRITNGSAYSSVNISGRLNGYYVHGNYGVRPVISLTSGTSASSGTGTATDPWVVTAP